MSGQHSVDIIKLSIYEIDYLIILFLSRVLKEFKLLKIDSYYDYILNDYYHSTNYIKHFPNFILF